MLNRIMQQVYANPPQGCQSTSFRGALETFFERKVLGAQKRYSLRFRNFAEFRRAPRSHWPGALEKFFAETVTRQQATEEYFRFKTWLRINRPRYVRPFGNVGIGLAPLGRHLNALGLIPWNFIRHCDIQSEMAWTKVDEPLRRKVAEFAEFLKVRSYAPGTINHRVGGLRILGRFLKERKVNYFEMTYELAIEFSRMVQARNEWSEWYRLQAFSSARYFYKWLLRRKEIEENHFEALGPIRITTSLPVFLTEAEINLILAQPLKVVDRALIEFFYATGCRVGEALGLNIDDLSLKGRCIKCLGKKRKERILIFNEATERALAAYLPHRRRVLKIQKRQDERALFITCWGGRISHNSIQETFRAMAYRVGVNKRVTPHVIRHTFATHLVENGADLYTLMTLMGHSSLRSTTRYLHVATKRIAEVYLRCHPRK